MRGRRGITAEERRLWAEVARSIEPLRGRARPAPPTPDPLPTAPVEASAPTLPAAHSATRPPPAAPPLVPLERRTIRALARGRLGPAATLDLHGLTQAEAHAALQGFLRRAQGAGHALVLVVTGKGARDRMGFDGERGVLRRLVPHWLGQTDLRSVVLGFEEAPVRRGGSGALVIRLRRGAGRA